MSVGGNIGGGVLLNKDSYEDGTSWGHEWIPKQLDNINNDIESAGDSRPDWLQT